MTVTLKTRIIGLVAVATVLPVLIMMGVITRLQSSVAKEVEEELQAVAERNVAQVTRDAYALCDLCNTIYERKGAMALRLGSEALNRFGWEIVASETVRWSVEDQTTGLKQEMAVPRFRLGGRDVERQDEFSTPAPLVDEVSRVMGGSCTLFQRVNQRGDMLRILTSVARADGRRGVGTVIPAFQADGSPDPVIAKVLAGETYRGLATVLKDSYLSAYQPLKNAAGEVVGMLFVGEKFQSMADLRRQLLNMRVGNTGYVFVVGAQGAEKGTYLVSKGGERDGENIWNSRDAAGNLFIQDIIKNALSSPAGEEQRFRYPWKNPGEAVAWVSSWSGRSWTRSGTPGSGRGTS